MKDCSSNHEPEKKFHTQITFLFLGLFEGWNFVLRSTIVASKQSPLLRRLRGAAPAMGRAVILHAVGASIWKGLHCLRCEDFPATQHSRPWPSTMRLPQSPKGRRSRC